MKVLNEQSLLDLALQASGHVEGAFALAQANGLSLTAELTPGQDVSTVSAPVIDADIQRFYAGREIRPATDTLAVAEEDPCNFCQYFM